MLAASLLEIRRLRGVMRPAIAVVIPSVRGPSVLIDAGANAESRPEHLLQFATMGAIFAEEILEIARARGRPALDRRRGGEGQPGDAGGAPAARGERPAVQGQRREPLAAGRCRGRRRHRRLHGQRLAEAARGHDPLGLRRLSRGDRANAARQARRAADQAGREAAARPARSGGSRRRVPARACAGSSSSRTATPRAWRSRTRSGWRRAASSTAWWRNSASVLAIKRGEDRVSILAPAESDG